MTVDLPSPAFGLTLHTGIQPGLDQTREAQDAEQLGYDVVSLHRDALHSDDPLFENWTLLTWLAAHTNRIRLAPVVLALPHRHPAVLAKMAETLDRLSGGRLILTLGGGGPMNEPAYRAFGLESRLPGEKVKALEEAIDIIRALWSTSSFSYPGQYFRTEGATIEPKPSHAIPIWLGAFGDRMLDLVGRKADGWFPTYQLLEPEQAYRKLERIRKAAQHAGRNPDHMTYGYTIPVLVEKGRVTTRGQIAGSPEDVARQLAALVRHGFTFLNVWPVGGAVTQRERLAREVFPIVRDLVV